MNEMGAVANTGWTGLRARLGSRYFDSDRRRRADRRFFAPVLEDLAEDEQVVDLGAGTGYLSLQIAREIPRGHVVAVDLSEDMLARLRDRARVAGLSDRVQTVCAEAAFTSLADESADRVVSSSLLHEVPDPGAVLAEAARLLRPGGRLVLKDFGPGLWWTVFRYSHPGGARGPLSPQQLRDALADANLVQVTVQREGRALIATARRGEDQRLRPTNSPRRSVSPTA
jgi:ubiquinone/menaquinone biosynthesis C-methylase UbiE